MENILICQYCGKECKNDNSKRSHERLCKSNPNRAESNFVKYNASDHKASNQFIKAKALGLPIPEGTRKGSVGYWRGKHLSEETKAKQRKAMREKILRGEMEVPYVHNHSSKVSFPEQYFMEVFKDLHMEYNYQVGLYQLDFALPNERVYVEIDGDQHYTDKRIVAHDIERTQRLKELGWECIERVRWSNYKKLGPEEQKEYCNKLIDLLKAHFI